MRRRLGSNDNNDERIKEYETVVQTILHINNSMRRNKLESYTTITSNPFGHSLPLW